MKSSRVKSFSFILPVLVFIFCVFFVSAVHADGLAEQIHKNAWSALVEESALDNYAKYAMYASRTLAVYNPEIYLQADAIWEAIITGYSGWEVYYNLRDGSCTGDEFDKAFIMTNNSFMQGKAGSFTPEQNFSWSNLQWDNHRANAIENSLIYPENVPFLAWLDLRLPSMWNSMNGMYWKTPMLSLAEFMYFQKRAEGENVYLAITDNGYGYVFSVNEEEKVLYNPQTGNPVAVSETIGKIVLVMNQTHVWYPLMGRDDRVSDTNLHAIVASSGIDANEMALTSFEQSCVDTLKTSTQLSSSEEILWGTIFAGKFVNQYAWRVSEIKELYRKLFPEYFKNGINFTSDTIDEMTGIALVITEMSNRLSPLAANLADLMTGSSVASCLTQLSNQYTEWFKRSDNNWVYRDFVHIWLPTFEDKTLSHYGNCFVEACNTGSAMTIKGNEDWEIYIPNWWEIVDGNTPGGHVIAGIYSASEKGTMSNNSFEPTGPLYSGSMSNLIFANIYRVGKGFVATAQYVNGDVLPAISAPFTNMPKNDTVSFFQRIGEVESDFLVASGRTFPEGDLNVYSASEYISNVVNNAESWESFWELHHIPVAEAVEDEPTPTPVSSSESSSGGGGGCSLGHTTLWTSFLLLFPLFLAKWI